jgi:hypothetical protein
LLALGSYGFEPRSGLSFLFLQIHVKIYVLEVIGDEQLLSGLVILATGNKIVDIYSVSKKRQYNPIAPKESSNSVQDKMITDWFLRAVNVLSNHTLVTRLSMPQQTRAFIYYRVSYWAYNQKESDTRNLATNSKRWTVILRKLSLRRPTIEWFIRSMLRSVLGITVSVVMEGQAAGGRSGAIMPQGFGSVGLVAGD